MLPHLLPHGLSGAALTFSTSTLYPPTTLSAGGQRQWQVGSAEPAVLRGGDSHDMDVVSWGPRDPETYFLGIPEL